MSVKNAALPEEYQMFPVPCVFVPLSVGGYVSNAVPAIDPSSGHEAGAAEDIRAKAD